MTVFELCSFSVSQLELNHGLSTNYIERYYFSGGCVIIDDHCLNYFIAIYNPQTPKVQVALPTLSNCLHEYYKIFTSFRDKRGTNIPYVIYVVGDFNLPKINWAVKFSPFEKNVVLISHMKFTLLGILTFLRLIGLTYLLVNLLTWNFWIWLPILD